MINANVRLRNSALRGESVTISEPFQVKAQFRNSQFVFTNPTNLKFTYKLASQANTYFVEASNITRTSNGVFEAYLTPTVAGTYIVGVICDTLQDTNTVTWVARNAAGVVAATNPNPILLPGNTFGGAADFAQLNDVSISSITAGQVARWNGTDWVNENLPYDIGIFISGTMTSNETVFQFIAPRDFRIPQNNGVARTSTPATSNTVIKLLKNDVQFGTLTFLTTMSSGTVLSSATSFIAGDRLTVQAPTVPDFTLGNISLVMLGIRL